MLEPLELGVAAGVAALVDAEAVVEDEGSVAEDLVELLQPLRANPAKIKVNNVVFFIGGLSCAPTDPALPDRFATQKRSFSSLGIDFRVRRGTTIW